MQLNEFQRPQSLATEPLAVTIPEAQRLSGFSRTAIYRELAAGTLRAVKLGNRTLVLTDSIRDRVSSLPPATFRPARAA